MPPAVLLRKALIGRDLSATPDASFRRLPAPLETLAHVDERARPIAALASDLAAAVPLDWLGDVAADGDSGAQCGESECPDKQYQPARGLPKHRCADGGRELAQRVAG